MVDYFQTDYLTVRVALTPGRDGRWLVAMATQDGDLRERAQGYVYYFNDAAEANMKFPYYPLRIVTGLRGLLTEKRQRSCRLVTRIHSPPHGVSSSGFWGSTFSSSPRPSARRCSAASWRGIRHDFATSVISAFAYNETLYASYVQQIAGRFALDLSGRYVHRNLTGLLIAVTDTIPRHAHRQLLPGRRDARLLPAQLDVSRPGLLYADKRRRYHVTVQPSGIMGVVPDTDYTKQQVFVRLGVTY